MPTRNEILKMVREVVRDEFNCDNASVVKVYGSVTKKMLGDIVGNALLSSAVIIVDGSAVRSVSNKKVQWE